MIEDDLLRMRMDGFYEFGMYFSRDGSNSIPGSDDWNCTCKHGLVTWCLVWIKVEDVGGSWKSSLNLEEG